MPVTVDAIDHVNLRIPEPRIDEAIDFYEGTLGFAVENLDAYREGEKPIFTFRLSPGAIVHVTPVDDEAFESPERENFDHLALRVREDIETVKQTLAGAGVEMTPMDGLAGATGVAPAVYVTDPFGYRIELKEAPNRGE